MPETTIPVQPYGFDDDMLWDTTYDGESRCRTSQGKGYYLVLGRASKPEEEVYLDACQVEGVDLYRRSGGGCAVLLDPGNLKISAVVLRPTLGDVRQLFDAFSQWLIDALDQTGVKGVKRQGISDLTLGDRKMGGSCLYLPRGLAYYSATVLVDPNLDLMERLLRHPPREPEYRRGRRHRDFLTSLSSEGMFRTAGELQDVLKWNLEEPHFRL